MWLGDELIGHRTPISAAVAIRRRIFMNSCLISRRVYGCDCPAELSFPTEHSMDASLALIVRKESIEATFIPLPRETRQWGNEVLELEGEQEYTCESLADVRWRISPVTAFLQGKVSPLFATGQAMFVETYGDGVDAYAVWLMQTEEEALAEGTLHPFEQGLARLLESVHLWALLFAPESDRLDAYLTGDAAGVISLLRHHIRFQEMSDGFLALASTAERTASDQNHEK